MDFVPVTYSREQKRRTRNSALTRLGVGVGVVGIPVALIGAFGGLLEMATFGLPVGVVGGLVTMMTAIETFEGSASARREERIERIRASLNEHYGLSLTPDQFEALAYPAQDPGAEFRTYGSIKVQDQVDGANFLERTLYLTATGGEMKLSESRDGKRFRELKPARQALQGSAASGQQALGASAPSETPSALPAPAGASA